MSRRNILADTHGGVNPLQGTVGDYLSSVIGTTRDIYHAGKKMNLWGDGNVHPWIVDDDEDDDVYETTATVTEENHWEQYDGDADPNDEIVQLDEFYPLTVDEEVDKYQRLYPYLDPNIVLQVRYPYGNPLRNMDPSPKKERPVLTWQAEQLRRMNLLSQQINLSIQNMEAIHYQLLEIALNKDATKVTMIFQNKKNPEKLFTVKHRV